jgi:hypothetical protein
MTRKILISLFLILIFFTTCRYKEGPLISFRSVEGRLKGTWQVVEFTSDGVDSLQNFKDSCGSKMRIWKKYFDEPLSKISFENGNYLKIGGSFSLLDNKKLIRVGFGNTQHIIIGPIGGISNWKILKLTFQEFKISTDFNGRNYNISFKK